MKKGVAIFMAILMCMTLFAACAPAAPEKTELMVGMVTDAGTIDDKSFNQGTWEGVLRAATDKLIPEPKYLKPTGTTPADYVREISNLCDSGFKMVVCPGFKFETAVWETQTKYPDVKFVILDGAPHPEDSYDYDIKSNTVGVFFAEHESGFAAGIAAAMTVKQGEFGFIGGMEIPAVQKFNWGFQQGVNYANANLGTSIVMKAENVVYQGSFDNVAAGTQLAAGMYDKGVNLIFAAAGGVGVGVINEAKSRRTAGKDVWVVGVDVDQYQDGVYEEGKSCILTSAMKKLDAGSYDMIKAELDGKFPGGTTVTLSAANDGVGIPAENPNLSADVTAKVAELMADMKAGKLVVAGEQGDLIK